MRYRFGDHELDLESFRLLRRGEPVAVEPRVFELLAYLVQQPNRLVTRDELLAEVWQGQIVAEGAVAQAVHAARAALGERSQDLGWIQTVHGRGYRFVGVVEPVQAEDAPAAVPVEPEWVGRRGVSLAVLGGIALVVLVGWWWQRDRGEDVISAPAATLALLPMVNATGDADLAWVELGLADLVARRIEGRGRVNLVPVSEVAGLMAGATDAKVGRQLLTTATGASSFVTAVLTHEDSTFRIRATLSTLNRPPRSEVFAGADLFAVAEALAGAVDGWVSGEAGGAVEAPAAPGRRGPAQQAFAQGMHEQLNGRSSEAARYYELALEHDADFVEARYELAIAVRRMGRREEAEKLGREVLRDAQVLGDQRLEAKANNHLGILLRAAGDADGARRHFEDSLRLHRLTGDRRGESTNLVNLAILDSDQGHWAGARERLDLALAIAVEIHDRRGEAAVLNSLGVLAWNQGDVEGSGRMHERALVVRREIGDRRNEAASLNNLGTVARAVGRFGEAEGLFRQGLAIRRDLGDRAGVASSLSNLAGVALDRGHWGESEGLYREALASCQELGLPRRQAYAASGMAELEIDRGRWGEAEEAIHQAQALFEQLGDRQRAAVEGARLIELQLRQGNREGVEAALADLQSSAGGLESSDLAIALEVIQGRLALLRGDLGAAREAFGRGIAAARRARSFGTEARLAVEAAELLVAQGGEPGEWLAGLGTQWDEWWRVHWVRSLQAAARGDGAAALAAAHQAKRLAGEAWSDTQQRHLEALTGAAPP